MGILVETLKEFKGFTIQSTIPAHSDSEEQVYVIINSEEWVDAISDYEELVDAISDPKNDPSNDSKVASYLHYQRNFSTKIIEEPVCPKDHPRRNPSD